MENKTVETSEEVKELLKETQITLVYNATHDWASESGGKGRLINKYKRYWYANQAIFDLVRNGFVEVDRSYETIPVGESKRAYYKVHVTSIWEKQYDSIIGMLTKDVME